MSKLRDGRRNTNSLSPIRAVAPPHFDTSNEGQGSTPESSTRSRLLASARTGTAAALRTDFSRDTLERRHISSTQVKQEQLLPVPLDFQFTSFAGVSKRVDRKARQIEFEIDPLCGVVSPEYIWCRDCGTRHTLKMWRTHCQEAHQRSRDEQIQIILRARKTATARSDASNSPSRRPTSPTSDADIEDQLLEQLPVPSDFNMRAFTGVSKKIQRKARDIELEADSLVDSFHGDDVSCVACDRVIDRGNWRAHCRDSHGRTQETQVQMVLRARAAAVKTIHSRSSTPDYPINSSAAPGRSKRNGRRLEQLSYKEDDDVDIDKGSVPTDTPPPRPRPSGLQSPMRMGLCTFSRNNTALHRVFLAEDSLARSINIKTKRIHCTCGGSISISISGQSDHCTFQYWNLHCVHTHKRDSSKVEILMRKLQELPTHGTKRAAPEAKESSNKRPRLAAPEMPSSVVRAQNATMIQCDPCGKWMKHENFDYHRTDGCIHRQRITAGPSRRAEEGRRPALLQSSAPHRRSPERQPEPRRLRSPRYDSPPPRRFSPPRRRSPSPQPVQRRLVNFDQDRPRRPDLNPLVNQLEQVVHTLATDAVRNMVPRLVDDTMSLIGSQMQRRLGQYPSPSRGRPDERHVVDEERHVVDRPVSRTAARDLHLHLGMRLGLLLAETRGRTASNFSDDDARRLIWDAEGVLQETDERQHGVAGGRRVFEDNRQKLGRAVMRLTFDEDDGEDQE